MCQFASMVITKHNKVFWSKATDSHSYIRREHGLPENGLGRITSVQIEFVPNELSFLSKKISDWSFNVDQDALPDWWNVEEAKAACWKVLPALCKARGMSMTSTKPRVRVPDGYERCPDDHVLRLDIDLGPLFKGDCDEDYRSTDNKKAYKGFQWVDGWAGKTPKFIRAERSDLNHLIFIRPKVKKTKKTK